MFFLKCKNLDFGFKSHHAYLQQVCVSMARQPVVLEMLFRAAPAQQGSTNLLIFSLLVPFIHRDGAIGQQARDALLLVMSASASHESVARYIAENSYFCPVGVDSSCTLTLPCCFFLIHGGVE